MILDIFIVLLVLCFILFIAAEYLDVVLHVAAFGILFILGSTIMLGGLTYKNGESVTQNFTYAASPFNTSVNQTTTVRTNVYATFTDTWARFIGIVICVISVFGGILVNLHYNKKRKGAGDSW